MARRIVNGNSFSEDGWPLVDQAGCNWVTVPGTNVTLQIQSGPPTALLRAWAADWNAYIEPLRDADSASWTPSNDVLGTPGRNNGSNHLGGTAVDLNWNSHPFRRRGSLNAAQMDTLSQMETFYEGTVFWAGRWNDPADEMHSQCGYNTYDQKNDRPFPKVSDFIARKIRADGLSTFRRGGSVTPPAAPSSDAADVLARATGVAADKAQQILVGVVNGLRDSQCNNVNRIAMWLAQMGHESAGFNATEEYASGSAYEGRSDLGNTQPGDGVRFKGRSWIQITGRSNYTKLSQWAFDKGIVPSPGFFVEDSTRLGQMQYAGLGPAWYWTVARPQINSLSDARNLTAVTQAINGGQNGADDRKNRYDRALALGDQLLSLTSPVEGEDDLSAEAERMIREMYDEYKKDKKGPTRSFFAPDALPVDSPLGFLYNLDGNAWNQEVTWGYLFGVRRAEELVNNVAQNGVAPASWAGQLTDAQGHWLAEWGQQWCLGLISFRAAIQKAFKAAGVAPTAAGPQVMNASITSADVQDIANRVSQQIAIPAPTPEPPAQLEVAQEPGDDWDTVADIGRSLEALKLADALPIDKRAPLQALISILQTKNGSQI